MGILVNQNQIGGGPSNTSHNIGDIFYTTRTDNSLNGAVECNGSQYNFSDFDSNLQNLLNEGKLPYVSIGEFDSMVSEKGWCDKIGYGTADLVLYAVYSASTGQGIQFYTNVLDWASVQRDSNDVLQGVKLYDKNTYQELVGWYVKLEVYLQLWYIYNPEDESQDFDGYMTRNSAISPHPTVTLPTGGEFQATTYFKVPKLSAYIIQKENIPVIGNGITLGFTDGSSNYGFSGVNSSPARTLLTTGADYGSTVGSVHVSDDNPNKTVGITTDPTKSGIISDLSNDSFTGRVMIQLFNSTTDTAVATCNQVLADVSALNQGDYVIETQIPTSENGYTWYRLYKSGWVEQGGFCSGTAENNPVTLAIEMKDTEYTIVATNMQTTAVDAWGWVLVSKDSKTTTGFSLGGRQGSGNTTPVRTNWQVSGMSAQK